MGGFFASLFDEMGARRRRLRAALGDRGQGIAEFLVMGGLLVGSLGLFVRDWMPAAAPWGFAVPVVFIAGYLLIDSRRQASIAAAESKLAEQAEVARAVARHERSDLPEIVDEDGRTVVDRTTSSYDWIVLLWSLACALAGAAAFVIAWSAEPPRAPNPNEWAPPESAVDVEISP